ncbi:MAG: hypothetical protein AABX89_03615 [Candidatus Thermoplasmatota archaeon]
MEYPVVYGLAWAAWVIVWGMAAFVLVVGPTKRANRRLALVFFLHGVAISVWVLTPLMPTARFAAGISALNLLSLLSLPFASIWFLATLDAAWSRPLRQPVGKVLLAAGTLAIAAPYFLAHDVFLGPQEPWVFGGVSHALTVPMLVLFELSVVLYLVAFAVAVQAFVSAPKGTPKRDQAFWFMLAFGLHDLYFVYRVAILAIVYQGGSAIGAGWVTPTILYGRPISLILWVLVLSYGMLRHQVLGLDLRLKLGLGRTIVVGVIAVAFFLVSETVEALLPIDGLLPGLVGAALVTLAIVPLQRAARRVMDRLMPNVQDNAAYRDRRAEDIYRMALDSARQDGNIGVGEQAMLDRLAQRLQLPAKRRRELEVAA